VVTAVMGAAGTIERRQAQVKPEVNMRVVLPSAIGEEHRGTITRVTHNQFRVSWDSAPNARGKNKAGRYWYDIDGDEYAMKVIK
jgi:hypothetical protein